MKAMSVQIRALDDQGQGIFGGDGEKSRVPFSIPGETWQWIPKLQLLQASPDRVEPPCPYFTRCGGCQLQHMSQERQGVEKLNWLCRVLDGVLPRERILTPIASPLAWHYRRRIQLHVGPRGEVGFYATKSRQVVPIDACLIADEELNAKILEVRKRAQGLLQGPKKPASLSFELTLLESGEVEIARDGEGRSFLQVNPEANQCLIALLRRVLEEKRPGRVLELYAGSGNLSFSLAQPGINWVAVESNVRAVEEAKKHPSKGIAWHQGQAAKIAERLYHSGQGFDLVLLDPPRGGAEDCLPLFRKWKPPLILYVSCNPSALKKDLLVLRKAGYEVDWVQPIDFFPQTMNWENVVLLSKVP